MGWEQSRARECRISVVLGIPVSFQPNVELEVAHRSVFLLGRSRAEPESPQFRRVWSMDRTICPWRRIVCVAALQQFFFNAGRANLERMIRDPDRSLQVSTSSPDLNSTLDKYVPEWMGEDAFDGRCFHSPWVQSYVCFSLSVKLESRGRVGRFSRSAKVKKLPASPSSSELSAHQTAPSGVIAHQRGRRALEPMEIFSSVQQ